MRASRWLFLLLVPALRAADPLPGHSYHGEAFDEGPRQAAVLIEGCGKVDFPITTKNSEAQKFFNQGVGQLHGFWYFEAERSFRQVAMLDPECAMAYWGCAMANVNNEKRAVGFINKAKNLRAKASKREQLWIDALANFYANTSREKKSRQMSFIKDTESIIHEFPEDLEAKAFLAWAIWHAKEDGVPMVSREAVDAVLSQVFAKEPMHPAHHYRIHLWDDDKPERALASAARCGQTSPAIAHMWHMPGHTFSKTDRLDDASWQQEAAARVDHAYMIRTQILPDQIHNYAHNTEWYIRTLNETGRAHDAIAQAKNLIEIPRHPRWNSIEKNSDSANYGRTRLFDSLLKFELWDELVALENSPYLDVSKNATWEAARLRALGVAYFFKDDKEGLGRQIEALKPFLPKPADTISPSSTAAAPTTAAIPPEKPATDPLKKSTQKNKRPDKPSAVTAAKELQALEAILNEDRESAQKLLTEANDIPKARLMRYQSKLGNQDKALQAANMIPQDAAGLALRVEALLQAGKTEDARKMFEKARSTSALLDAEVPLSHQMDAAAAQLGFSKAWRNPPTPRPDSGERPPQESLGPILWHPWNSPDFSLSDKDGRQVALSQFHGKPVIVIFYLGHVCGHCVEQLKAFAAAAKNYETAGFKLIAVGAEPAAELAETAALTGLENAPNVTLLSDAKYESFKKWRCFDDFEGMGLHGAFLVDGGGQVRWADVGYEPFKDAAFLLQESQRLLRFGAQTTAQK
jgi:peroxiredoxin